MAKIKLADEYEFISGRAGDLVLYRWKGKECCRVYVIPSNPDTLKQRANRNRFAEASISWKSLPDEIKELYNRRVVKMRLEISGFNLYISDYMKGVTEVCYRDITVQPVNNSSRVHSLLLHSQDPLHICSVCHEKKLPVSLYSSTESLKPASRLLKAS